jgi:hypothetical protein
MNNFLPKIRLVNKFVNRITNVNCITILGQLFRKIYEKDNSSDILYFVDNNR